MAEEKKNVRGGFRATLALVISIIAVILALVSFSRSGVEHDLQSRIKDLQVKLEAMKKESAERVDRVREETAEALGRLSEKLKAGETEQ